MNDSDYKLSRVQPMPTSASEGPLNVVEVDSPGQRRWNEPVYGAKGVDLQIGKKEEDPKPLNRFYPPLLCLSTFLTALFFWLYLTKPVIVSPNQSSPNPTSTAATSPVSGASEEQGMEPLSPLNEPEQEGVLQPFPDQHLLPGEEVISTSEVAGKEAGGASLLEETKLKMRHSVLVDSGVIPMDRYDFEVPVFYEGRTMVWEQEQIESFRLLAKEMERHLEDVKIVRENGERLMLEYQALVRAGMPVEALLPDSFSLPEASQRSFQKTANHKPEGSAHD
ncbi:MAG: hypothetical protein Q7Q71_13155 [Verrucomicrobiota bacterium JB023]|nr:hypothetical protein [Verrucomicrobiota bacterium JB023]